MKCDGGRGVDPGLLGVPLRLRLLSLLLILVFLGGVAVEARSQCACKLPGRQPARQASISHLDDDEPSFEEGSSSGSVELPPGPKDENEFRVLLGRSTWRLLHTMAARYPDQPDVRRRERMAKFIELISWLYPCAKCARHMRTMLADDPPQLASQHEFSQWLCNIHNKVNVRLNKATFPCTNVDSHYDCGCEVGGGGATTEETTAADDHADKPIRPSSTPGQKELPGRAVGAEQHPGA